MKPERIQALCLKPERVDAQNLKSERVQTTAEDRKNFPSQLIDTRSGARQRLAAWTWQQPCANRPDESPANEDHQALAA